MIVFDLKCAHGHVFEAWFGSSDDFAGQRERGLVACPLCGDSDVVKAAMAPAVPAKGNRRSDKQPVAAHPPAAVKSMLAAMAEVQAKVEANCDYVGDRFADEARAIHHGERERRGIYGEATPEQAVALKEEGIEVAALPFRLKRAADA